MPSDGSTVLIMRRILAVLSTSLSTSRQVETDRFRSGHDRCCGAREARQAGADERGNYARRTGAASRKINLARIEAPECGFDLCVEALAALNDATVPKSVIAAMIACGPSPVPQSLTSGQSLPSGYVTHGCSHARRPVPRTESAVTSLFMVHVWAPCSTSQVGVGPASAQPGTIAPVADNGELVLGDGNPATSAQLANSGGVAVDRWGNLFHCGHGWRPGAQGGAAGVITTVAGTGRTPERPRFRGVTAGWE